MNIEEVVRTSMDRMAGDLQPTMPDPAALRARVNRRSRIRSAAAIGLAAAVAAGVIVGVAELRDQNEPTPPANQGIGSVDTAIWMVDGVLHIGDRQYPQDKTITTALAPVQGGAVYGAAGDEIVYQPLVGPAQVIATDAKWGPAADPDSDLVAWLAWSKPDGRYDLWLYDIGRGSEITAMPLEAELTGRDNPFGDNPLTPIEWVGDNPKGGYTVLFAGADDGPRRTDLKANGGGTVREFGSPVYDMTLDVLADADQENQITFTAPAGSDISSVDGVRAEGGLSHDGAYFAGLNSSGEGGAIAVVDTQTGQTRYIDAPEGSAPSHLSWASDHTLMFLAPNTDDESTSGSVYACDADTLQCTNVADFDDISSVALPTM